MLQGSGSSARTANQAASGTSHPADYQALSSHPAGSSAPPVSPRPPRCCWHMQRTVTAWLVFPWSNRYFLGGVSFFGIMGQVAEHDYIEGRKWGTGITNPHVQAT